MTTGSVFGKSDINNRPEFAGVDPRNEVRIDNNTEIQRIKEAAEQAVQQEREKVRLYQEAISKFLSKEITKVEFELVLKTLNIDVTSATVTDNAA